VGSGSSSMKSKEVPSCREFSHLMELATFSRR